MKFKFISGEEKLINDVQFNITYKPEIDIKSFLLKVEEGVRKRSLIFMDILRIVYRSLGLYEGTFHYHNRSMLDLSNYPFLVDFMIISRRSIEEIFNVLAFIYEGLKKYATTVSIPIDDLELTIFMDNDFHKSILEKYDLQDQGLAYLFYSMIPINQISRYSNSFRFFFLYKFLFGNEKLGVVEEMFEYVQTFFKAGDTVKEENLKFLTDKLRNFVNFDSLVISSGALRKSGIIPDKVWWLINSYLYPEITNSLSTVNEITYFKPILNSKTYYNYKLFVEELFNLNPENYLISSLGHVF